MSHNEIDADVDAEWKPLLGQLARASRGREPHDPEVLAIRRDFAAARLEAQIKKYLAAAPRLTEAQYARLRALFLEG